MNFRDSRDAGIDILFGIILATGAVYIAHSAILIHGTRKVIPKQVNTSKTKTVLSNARYTPL